MANNNLDMIQSSTSVVQQTLKCLRPAGPHLVHGTLPVPRQPFNPAVCPYSIRNDNAELLVTQWELVGTCRDYMVVELQAWNPFSATAGFVNYDVVQTRTLGAPAGASFSATVIDKLDDPDNATIEIVDQQGTSYSISLTGVGDNFRLVRGGLNGGFVRFTSRRHVVTPVGGFVIMATWGIGTNQIDYIVKWHNQDYAASRPDIYFDDFSIDPGTGWKLQSWEDNVQNGVTAGGHIMPQLYEREFRFSITPTADTFVDYNEGWAVGDWSQGGYLTTRLIVPDLSDPAFDVDWPAQRTIEINSFNSGQNHPLWPNPTNIPSTFWPTMGTRDGNATSGTDMHNFPWVETAYAGHPDALLQVQIQNTRNHARHPFGVLEASGDPVNPDAYENPDSSTPWFIANFVFQPKGGFIQDAPFYYSQAVATPGGPGIGNCLYESELKQWKPNNEQHYVRTTKNDHALVWLDNDPMARFNTEMLGTAARMILWEKNKGKLVSGFGAPGDTISGWGRGKGIKWGRDEAWGSLAICMQYATTRSTGTRATLGSWLALYALALQAAIMPNGMTHALDKSSKVSSTFPYSSIYFAGSSLEHTFLMTSLQAIRETVDGVDSQSLLETIIKMGESVWDYQWHKPDGVPAAAPTNNVPVGPQDPNDPLGPGSIERFDTQADWPQSLVDNMILSLPPNSPTFLELDNFHTGVPLGFLLALQGTSIKPIQATIAMMGAASASQAYDFMKAEGITMLNSRALLLAKFQEAFG